MLLPIVCNKDKCPPCQPYSVGRLGYIDPRTIQRGKDGARNNNGVGIIHYKVYSVQQNPKNCECRWEQTKKVMKEYGNHTEYISNGAINLNGKGDPPSYP